MIWRRKRNQTEKIFEVLGPFATMHSAKSDHHYSECSACTTAIIMRALNITDPFYREEDEEE